MQLSIVSFLGGGVFFLLLLLSKIAPLESFENPNKSEPVQKHFHHSKL